MPSDIIDLDEILPDDKRVKLQGTIYTLPPEIPVELFLRINKMSDDGVAEDQQVGRLYEEILELFRYKQPDLEKLPLGLGQLMGAISQIYGNREADAPRPPRAGTKSTRKPRRRSASST